MAHDPRVSRGVEAGISLPAMLGEEVRTLRRGLNLTIAELGAAAGLSSGMLSKIENGAISPSLDTLQSLAKALNVPIRDLFADSSKDAPCSLVKAGTSVRINRRGTKVGHIYSLLVSRSFGRDSALEPYLITLNDGSTPCTTFRHSGDEFIYMLSGKLKYRHGSQSYLLEPGDALFFDAAARHGPEEFVSAPITYVSIVSRDSRG